MDYIDDQVESVNEWEARQNMAVANAAPKNDKVIVGKVDQFFDNLNVAAIALTSGLKVGDIIEIGDDEEAIRQRISSMQIERVDVSEAKEGDSVGVKLKHKVPVGSDVYKMNY